MARGNNTPTGGYSQFKSPILLKLATDTGYASPAIMARSLEIPAIVGTKEVTSIKQRLEISLSYWLLSVVALNPSEEVIAEYRAS